MRNVMVADDEESIRHALSRVLEQSGFASQAAASAEEALHVALLTSRAGALERRPMLKPAVDPQDPSFDLDAALGFFMDDRVLLAKQSRRFLQSLQGELDTISRAFQSGDVDMALRLAHSLKGAAALLGASRFRRLAEGIELACRRGDAEGGRALLPDLIAEAGAYQRAVAPLLEEQG